MLAAAMDTPVAVMETAGEGGPWGMALLAAYLVRKEEGESLGDYLNNRVFADAKGEVVYPNPADVEGFNVFAREYLACIPAMEQLAEAL